MRLRNKVLKKIFEFILGKKPPIFNEKGELQHDLPPRKWELWRKRYTSEAERNWRNHSGIRAKDHK